MGQDTLTRVISIFLLVIQWMTFLMCGSAWSYLNVPILNHRSLFWAHISSCLIEIRLGGKCRKRPSHACWTFSIPEPQVLKAINSSWTLWQSIRKSLQSQFQIPSIRSVRCFPQCHLRAIDWRDIYLNILLLLGGSFSLGNLMTSQGVKRGVNNKTCVPRLPLINRHSCSSWDPWTFSFLCSPDIILEGSYGSQPRP